MVNINFVPDDYAKTRESYRINMMYLVLLAVVIAALGVAFNTIRTRQRASVDEQTFVDLRITSVQGDIKKYEEFEMRRTKMMQNAIITSELLDLVPRTVLLALLTNNLPSGVSFLELNIVQKRGKFTAPKNTNKFEIQKAKMAAITEQPQKSQLITYISIQGVAPSDLQVATYIEHLSDSTLLDNVALVESRDCKIQSTSDGIFVSNVTRDTGSFRKCRKFKLTAVLKPDAYITNNDIADIRTKL